ncbi:hypothetical protein C8Q80DRAFT_928278 [Daedaleopsis nitida]|nr:hypothetical protein C8Q80DRAFT_928278 [Daedaleopsis nitida]
MESIESIILSPVLNDSIICDIVNTARASTGGDAVQQARTSIETAVEAYSHALVKLREGLNALTPIGRLPTEILGRCIVFLAQDTFDAHVHRGRGALSWIPASHVCGSWRAVALATPGFWASIRYHNMESFRVLLARCKSAPFAFTSP